MGNSPDARRYPFVLGFRTKDIAKRQEHGLKDADSLAADKKAVFCKLIR